MAQNKKRVEWGVHIHRYNLTEQNQYHPRVALRGTVTIIPISSIAAFEARHMFTCPYDKKNPNRFFPGDKNGSYTEQHAAILMEEDLSLFGSERDEVLAQFEDLMGDKAADE